MDCPAFQAPTPETLTALLPAYEVEAFVAKGAMGAVYMARQRSLGRHVALKILPRELGEDAVFRQSFETEARAMAQLNHPNLIGVIDFGAVDGLLYIVMEWVPGKSLHHSARGQVIDPEQAVEIVLGICRGLEHAHEAGVVHGDIKPANILLTPKREPKIGDFGLARPKDGAGEVLAMGTPGYAAPEVIRDPANSGARSDLYAVGVILYELLTGESPRSGCPAPSELVGCDPRLDMIWRTATRRNPDQRYADAESMAEELQGWLEGPRGGTVLNTRSSERVRPAAPVRQSVGVNWALLRNMVVIVLLLAAIAGMWRIYLYSVGKNEEEKQAAHKVVKEAPVVILPTPGSVGMGEEVVVPVAVEPPPVEEIPIPAETPEASLARLAEELAAGKRGEMPIGTVRRGSSSYFLVKEAKGWRKAGSFARAHGGHLALVAGEEELQWLATEFGSAEVPAFWLGASGSADGTWRGVDGKVFAASGAAGAPGGYAAMGAEGQVMAAGAEAVLPFVIQWQDDGSIPDGTRELLLGTAASLEAGAAVFPEGTLSRGAEHVLVVDRESTFEEARELAELGGGGLLSLPTAEAADWIAAETAALGSDLRFWLGGERRALEWVWLSGQRWTTARWEGAGPTGLFDNLVLVPGVGWRDADPEETADGFIVVWGREDSPELGTPEEPVDLAVKAEELLLVLNAKRQTALAANTKAMVWDLDVWLRSGAKSEVAQRTPGAEAVKEHVAAERIPVGLPERPNAKYPQKLLEIVGEYFAKQEKIDAGFYEHAVKIRDAYVERLAEQAAVELERGQPGLVAAIERRMEEAVQIVAWVGSFPAIGPDPAPRMTAVKVISASYGSGGKSEDVTAQAVQLIEVEQEDFWVNPGTMKADPNPGWHKYFKVVYEVNGVRKSRGWWEDNKVPVAVFWLE